MSKQSVREGLIAVVAAALAVNATDLRILGAVHQAGILTAGDAAAAASLSPAATSAAIQRLVKAGLLSRRADPSDRRRAALTLTSRAAGVIADSYGPIAEQGKAGLARWSRTELAIILQFLTFGTRFQREHADRIRRSHG